MKNTLRTLSAFSLIALAAAAIPASAASYDALHVSVPFSFKAGNMTMPAGEYTVSETSPHVLLIRGRSMSAFLPGNAGAVVNSGSPGLSFIPDGSGYTLKMVHVPGEAATVLAPTKSVK
jgi:hypothetical protein